MSARIRAGLVGAGFIGPWHVDALRRLGNVDVVALAGSRQDSAQAAADKLGIARAYGDYQALLDDGEVDVVHIAAPNHLHHPVAMAAIARGKHVVCDKPLANTAAQGRELLDAAREAGVFHAVTFNYRGNPLVQQARQMVINASVGRPTFIHGRYLQDWLLHETDWSWRLEADKSGPSSALADIGSHWCDLAQHVAGCRIVEVLAELGTAIPRRRKPTAGGVGTFGANAGQEGEWVEMTMEDLASVLLRFDNGARGVVSVGQVCAGHKNDLVLEVCGTRSSVKWRQEAQNELWIGHRDRANELLQKDPSLMDPAVSDYARLPGGHQEAWADAFGNLMRDIYAAIARWPKGGKIDEALPPTVATFEDGLRALNIVDAMLASAAQGGVWTRVGS
jgi:predicted dehydrogenase